MDNRRNTTRNAGMHTQWNNFTIYKGNTNEKGMRTIGCKIGANPTGKPLKRVLGLSKSQPYKFVSYIRVDYKNVRPSWRNEEGSYHRAFRKNMTTDLGKEETEWFRGVSDEDFIKFAEQRKKLWGGKNSKVMITKVSCPQ